MADDTRELPDDSKAPDIDYQKDIANPSLEDIMEEAAEEEEARLHPAKPKDETPEPPKEEPKVEPKPAEPEPPKEEPKPAFDEETLTDKIAAKLVDKLAPEDATKAEKKDLRTQIKDMQDKAKDEGRELTYDEALEFLAKTTTENVKASLKDEVKQEVLKDLAKEVQDEETRVAQEAKEKKDYEEQRTKAWNTQWDTELADLETAGKLPKVINADDPNDPGRKERIALFETMKQVNDERLAKGQPPVLNLVQVHALYYKSPNAQPEGATAPVAGARRAVSPTTPGEYSYQDVHNASLEDIMSGK